MPGESLFKVKKGHTFNFSVGQLYRTNQTVASGFDAGYTSGKMLEKGTMLMCLGGESMYQYTEQERKSCYSFLCLQENRVVWISKSWIDIKPLDLVPCDD